MGVINMAHGELMMLGAYTTWVVQQLMPQRHRSCRCSSRYRSRSWSPRSSASRSSAASCASLYGRPLETLLATFGVSLVLQQRRAHDLLAAEPRGRHAGVDERLSSDRQRASRSRYNRLYIIVFSMLVFVALLVMLRYTHARAPGARRDAEPRHGPRDGRAHRWVDAMTFGLGSGVAGLAGVALSQLTNVGPNLGQSHIVDSFMVVVFGGVGNLWGTLVAGLSLGIANKFLEPYRRRRAGEDLRARLHHPVHPEAAARACSRRRAAPRRR